MDSMGSKHNKNCSTPKNPTGKSWDIVCSVHFGSHFEFCSYQPPGWLPICFWKSHDVPYHHAILPYFKTVSQSNSDKFLPSYWTKTRYLLHCWGLASSDKFEYGMALIMSHVVNECPLIMLSDGGL